MISSEHYSVIRWQHDGAYDDVTAQIAGCRLTLTQRTEERYTLGGRDPLIVQGGRSILLTLDVVCDGGSPFFRALLAAGSTPAPLTLDLYQPDMTPGSRRAAGSFMLRQIAPLVGARSGDGRLAVAQAVLVGGRGFTHGWV